MSIINAAGDICVTVWVLGYRTVSCSTQPSMVFQLLIKLKLFKIKAYLALKPSDIVVTILINVKMPITVGILYLVV